MTSQFKVKADIFFYYYDNSVSKIVLLVWGVDYYSIYLLTKLVFPTETSPTNTALQIFNLKKKNYNDSYLEKPCSYTWRGSKWITYCTTISMVRPVPSHVIIGSAILVALELVQIYIWIVICTCISVVFTF
jgi:hypothetical protein